MTALAKDRKTNKLGVDDTADPLLLSFPVLANAVFFGGAIVVTDANGFAKPGLTSTTVKAWGRCEKAVNNTGGADGAVQVLVRQGVFFYENSSAGDLIAADDVGKVVFIVDDQTVALTDGGATRSKAGVVYAVDSFGKVGVFLGIAGLY